MKSNSASEQKDHLGRASGANLEKGNAFAVAENVAFEKRKRIIFPGIEVGTPVSIQFPGVKGRYYSKLVGFEPHQFLIVKLPSIPGIRERFKSDIDVVIRFVSNGSVIGVLSSIMQIHYEPVGVAFLAFPVYAERIELRKERRVQCFFAAHARVRGIEFEGALLDICPNGCRFSVEVEKVGIKKLTRVERGDKILLDVEGFASGSIEGGVMNTRDDGSLFSFGIQFTTIHPDLLARINEMQDLASRFQQGDKG